MTNHLDVLGNVLNSRIRYIRFAEPTREQEAIDLTELLSIVTAVKLEPNQMEAFDTMVKLMPPSKLEDIVFHLSRMIVNSESKVIIDEIINRLRNIHKVNDEPVNDGLGINQSRPTDEFNQVTKEVIEVYANEILELEQLIKINQSLLSTVKKDQEVAAMYENRISKCKRMQKFYQRRINELKNGKAASILFANERGKDPESKLSHLTSKLLVNDDKLFKIGNDIESREAKELIQIEKLGRSKLMVSYRAAKINHLQKKVAKLKTKKSNLQAKQRKLIVRSIVEKEIKKRNTIMEDLYRKTDQISGVIGEYNNVQTEITSATNEQERLKAAFIELMKSKGKDTSGIYEMIGELNSRITILRRKAGHLEDKRDKIYNKQLAEELNDNQRRELLQQRLNQLRNIPRAIVSGFSAFNKEMHPEIAPAEESRVL